MSIVTLEDARRYEEILNQKEGTFDFIIGDLNGDLLFRNLIIQYGGYPFPFNGTEYENFTHLSNCYGKEEQLVAARVSRGFTLPDALNEPIRVVNRRKKIVVNSQEYNSFREACNSSHMTTSYVNTFAKMFGLKHEIALSLLIDFYKDIPGEKPVLFSSTPCIVYNNKWYVYHNEFGREIGIKNIQFLLDEQRYEKHLTFAEMLCDHIFVQDVRFDSILINYDIEKAYKEFMKKCKRKFE